MENWAELFYPQQSLLTLFIRVTVTYLALFVILRLTLRREIGSLAVADLLLIMLFAEALQSTLVAESKSITEGLAAICVLVFWNYVLDWLTYRFPALERWMEPPPILLIRNGKVLHRNLRREMITENELTRQIREKGVEELSRVKAAYIEGDGKVSVILYE